MIGSPTCCASPSSSLDQINRCLEFSSQSCKCPASISMHLKMMLIKSIEAIKVLATYKPRSLDLDVIFFFKNQKKTQGTRCAKSFTLDRSSRDYKTYGRENLFLLPFSFSSLSLSLYLGMLMEVIKEEEHSIRIGVRNYEVALTLFFLFLKTCHTKSRGHAPSKLHATSRVHEPNLRRQDPILS